jgi:hypothetical protein
MKDPIRSQTQKFGLGLRLGIRGRLGQRLTAFQPRRTSLTPNSTEHAFACIICCFLSCYNTDGLRSDLFMETELIQFKNIRSIRIMIIYKVYYNLKFCRPMSRVSRCICLVLPCSIFLSFALSSYLILIFLPLLRLRC